MFVGSIWSAYNMFPLYLKQRQDVSVCRINFLNFSVLLFYINCKILSCFILINLRWKFSILHQILYRPDCYWFSRHVLTRSIVSSENWVIRVKEKFCLIDFCQRWLKKLRICASELTSSARSPYGILMKFIRWPDSRSSLIWLRYFISWRFFILFSSIWWFPATTES